MNAFVIHTSSSASWDVTKLLSREYIRRNGGGCYEESTEEEDKSRGVFRNIYDGVWGLVGDRLDLRSFTDHRRLFSCV